MGKHDSRYGLLTKHLQMQAGAEVPMGFSEIEQVIGTRLPKSAKLYRTWWSNNASNHVQAKAWLGAGYCTEHVDMDGTKLVFVRSNAARGMVEPRHEYTSLEKTSDRHPLIGAMKGTFTIEPGWDLTKPAMDPEELDAMDANIERTADLVEKGLSRKSQ